MKILYLLFAVFFLVAQSTEAPLITWGRGYAAVSLPAGPLRCILRGGTCFYLRCPPFVRTLIGRCFSGGVCC
ncbi:unnamed protein product, partial [Lepidochelys olivacea]